MLTLKKAIMAVAALMILCPNTYLNPGWNMDWFNGDRSSLHAAEESDMPVYLYFTEPGGRYLKGEAADMEKGKDLLLNARRIMEELIEGPRGGLIPTLPKQTRVRAVYVLGRTVYVDLSSEITENHPGGIGGELLTVYSIVNTLILNLEGIDRIRLLVDGAETETLAGHVDIGRPLNAQMLLVR